MKYCKDCVHYDNSIYGSNILPLCNRSSSTNMVSGEETIRSCQETREDVAMCGKDASWFEPKDAK